MQSWISDGFRLIFWRSNEGAKKFSKYSSKIDIPSILQSNVIELGSYWWTLIIIRESEAYDIKDEI